VSTRDCFFAPTMPKASPFGNPTSHQHHKLLHTEHTTNRETQNPAPKPHPGLYIVLVLLLSTEKHIKQSTLIQASTKVKQPNSSTLQPTMAAAVAPHYTFSFDEFLKREYRFGIAPDQPTCKAFLAGHCPLGNSCPDKHPARTTQYNK
jgi:hypothetical protein